MNKQEVYQFLQEKNIWFEVTEHKAVYNMEEVAEIEIPYPEADAKTLFIRDDKKKNYYLITVKGSKRAVTPLGILNDQDKEVKVFFDRELTENEGLIGVHPNENTATVWMKTQDLIEIIREHGNEVVIVDFKQ